jgi:hypothetical protein
MLTVAGMTSCSAPPSSTTGPTTSSTIGAAASTTGGATSTTLTQASVPPCTAAQLTARGGRQGGGFQTAHGDVELTRVGPSECLLDAPPDAIAIVRADGTTLDVRYEPGRATTPPLVLPPGGMADLTVNWANWCGPDPGPLRLRITLPNGGGTLESSFDGPPDYDYLPGCVTPGEGSTLLFTGYAGGGGASAPSASGAG